MEECYFTARNVAFKCKIGIKEHTHTHRFLTDDEDLTEQHRVLDSILGCYVWKFCPIIIISVFSESSSWTFLVIQVFISAVHSVNFVSL